ncbi:helix-turn-helix domain-containing protein [Limosilactobacillus reuteri]|uniref:helix-turn-helix domain-containing protein n=2 Tax=Limosilactobacillus reuteri TaxID=1598 RepID=UPI003D0458FA
MNFGEQIKQQRKALDMSQEEVAKRLFVTRQTISNWENGKNYPDLSMLVKISDVYQVSIDSLLKEDTKLKEYLSKKEVRTVYNPASDLSIVIMGLVLIVLTFSGNTVLPEVVYSIITLAFMLLFAAWVFFDKRLYNLIADSNPTTQSQEGVAYKVFSKTLIVILWILLVLTMGTALLSFLNIIPNVITMKLGTVKLNIQMIGDSSPSVVAITVGIITALFGIVRFVKDIRSSLKKSHHRKN